MRKLAVALCLGSLACGGGDGGAGERDACASAQDGAACADGGVCRAGICRRTVTGSWMEQRWRDGSWEEAGPMDLTGPGTIRALAETASGYEEQVAVGHADGTFEIPDVPIGTYWLAITGWTFLDFFEERSESTVQLVSHAPGPPRATPGTTVTWQVSGAVPAAPEEAHLEVFSFDAIWDAFPVAVPPPAPAPSAPASFTSESPPLFDGAVGDQVRVVLVSPVVAAGTTYLAATAAAELPPTFAVQDGAAQTVPVTLEPLAMSEVTFEWDCPSFEEALGEPVRATCPQLCDPPTQLSFSHELRLTSGFGQGGGSFEVELASLHAQYGSPAARLGGLRYGRLGIEGWVERWRHTASWRVELTGGGRTNRTLVSVEASGVLRAGATAPVAPVITAPRALAVTPAPGAAPPGVGLTPTVTWSPPARGTPSRYLLDVRGPGSARTLFSTPRRRVVIPPGVLAEGAPFYVSVTAIAEDGSANAVAGNFVP